MAVAYGKGFVKSTLGILKIVEIILIVVTILIMIFGTANYYYGNGYYAYGSTGSAYFPLIFGLVVSIMLLILCCWKSVADAIDCVLRFQFILLLIIGLWILIAVIWIMIYHHAIIFIIACILGCATGIVYLVDAAVSFQAYDVCK